METRVNNLEQLLQGILANEMNMVVELLSSLSDSNDNNEMITEKSTTITDETSTTEETSTKIPQSGMYYIDLQYMFWCVIMKTEIKINIM